MQSYIAKQYYNNYNFRFIKLDKISGPWLGCFIQGI